LTIRIFLIKGYNGRFLIPLRSIRNEESAAQTKRYNAIALSFCMFQEIPHSATLHSE